MINQTKFKSNIKAIKSKGAQLDDMIHESACFAVFHSVKDGQITPAIDLVNAMPKSGRRSNLISWLAKYGNISYKKNEIVHCKHHVQDEVVAYIQYDEAYAVPFWLDFADAVIELKPFDFDEKLVALLHQAKLAQSGESKKYNGLGVATFIEKIKALLPNETVQKIDFVKTSGKVVNLTKPITLDQVALAA